MAEEHVGFANAVSPKGKAVDARKVKPFKDESDAGKVRAASQSTPSSIVDFHTNDQSTDGAPAAVVVPKSKASEPDEADAPAVEEAEGQGANEG